MPKKKQLQTSIDNLEVDNEIFNVKEPVSEDLKDSKMQYFNPNHQRITHMHLSGATLKEIANVIGYSISYVRMVLARPEIKEAIESIQREEDDIIRQGVKALRMKALKKMSDLIDSKQDAIAYQAARDVLDRTGHKGTVKQEVNVNVTFEQQLNDILKDKNIIELDDYEVAD